MKLKIILSLLFITILLYSSDIEKYQFTLSSTSLLIFLFLNLTIISIIVYILKKGFEKKIELKKNEFDTILKNIPDLLWIKDKDGRYLECNKRFEDFFGAKKDEIVGKTDFDFVDKELAEFFTEHDNNAMKSDVPLSNFEKVTFKSDGHEEYLQTTKTKVKNNSSEVIGILGIGRDLTIQKENENRLIEQKEELETIFNCSRDAILVVNRKLDILNFNKEFTDIFGFNEDILLNMNYLDLLLKENKEKTLNLIEECVNNGLVENLEGNCISSEDKIIPINYSISLLPDKQRFLIFIRDITSLKIAEQQTRLASMGEMIGNIAHQWRQPLSAITTNVSGLSVKADLDMQITNEEFLHCSKEVMKHANYLSDTIDNFRNFIKGEKINSIISIKNVIENTISLVNASLSSLYIKLVLELDDDIEVLGSKNELSEAFINIINNAKDVLNELVESEDDRYIFIKTKKIKEDELLLLIYDSAGGIDASIKDRIFEPYFTTKYKSQGTGLGLVMVDKIIRERHHYKLNVYNKDFTYNNKEYIGACFEIIIKAN